MTGPEDETQRASIDLTKVLNSHGFGFQYAVLRRVEELNKEQRKAAWDLGGTEFPVVAKDETTHIDFVLLRQHLQINATTHLVAECKRVNPTFSRWCFVRTPYSATEGFTVFEQIRCDPPNKIIRNAFSIQGAREPYQLGLELKGQPRSDGGSSGRGAINDAVAQVLRGTSGLINHVLGLRDGGKITKRVEEPTAFRFIPVIFTTAKLWVSNADLRKVDLQTGDLDSADCTKADWIWFNYNRSPKLRHDLEWTHSDDLRKDLELEFTRSIAIVSTAGVDSFLSMGHRFF